MAGPLQFLPSLDMMHYPTIDTAAVQGYNAHSPNVTVMNRGAAMQAAAWQQQGPSAIGAGLGPNLGPSCRYNASLSGNTADYLTQASGFAPTSDANFYENSYRHSLMSATSGVYYPTHSMLVNRGIASPTEMAATSLSASKQELASPDSQTSKGTYSQTREMIVLA